MFKVRQLRDIAGIIGFGVCLAAIVVFIFWLPAGTRSVGELESIDGIPLPISQEALDVLEKLAHADIYVASPVFAKKLVLEIAFNPGNTTELAVGVRENDFWLSYPKTVVWNSSRPAGEQTALVEIPLTDKFQEPDQSVDLMFFAEGPSSTADVDEGTDDQTHWRLSSISAVTAYAIPTAQQAKDYLRSVARKERTQ